MRSELGLHLKEADEKALSYNRFSFLPSIPTNIKYTHFFVIVKYSNNRNYVIIPTISFYYKEMPDGRELAGHFIC
jgi:hypothetical protein